MDAVVFMAARQLGFLDSESITTKEGALIESDGCRLLLNTHQRWHLGPYLSLAEPLSQSMGFKGLRHNQPWPDSCRFVSSSDDILSGAMVWRRSWLSGLYAINQIPSLCILSDSPP